VSTDLLVELAESPGLDLSICVPTYNRAAELRGLISTLAFLHPLNFEVIFIDDGSTDGTREVILESAQMAEDRILYKYQKNQGRYAAITAAVALVRAPLVMIVDSDDAFLAGAGAVLSKAFADLAEVRTSNPRLSSLIFELTDNAGLEIGTPLRKVPVKVSNFVALRADFEIRGDKKEVVPTLLLRRAISKVSIIERRVPTLLLWAHIAEESDCLVVGDPVMTKNYLVGGMSQSVKALAAKSPKSMLELNLLLSKSVVYRSIFFRLRAYLQAARYMLVSQRFKAGNWQVYLLIPLAVPFFFADLFRLKKQETRSRNS
jgi:glycosyltransferase involved in cell wall biosynthesis